MSATNPLPLIKEVENWKRNDIIDFLKDDKDPFNLDLDADDIEIIQKRKISGTDFLDLTAEKLGNYGMESGPASRIGKLIKRIKGEGNSQL